MARILRTPVLFLFALTFAAAQAGAANPALVTAINFTLSEAGQVQCSGDTMRDLIVNISLPGNSPYQTVRSDANVTGDSQGNAFAIISSANPANPFHFNISLSGTVTERTTRSLPAVYYVGAEFGPFLSPSDKIQSGDPAIAAAARSAIVGARDDWERVVRLANFVHSYLVYDAALSGAENDASWAYQNQRGVCVEFAYLYAAMARSSGIPTRIVSGFAFSQDAGWLGHAWAESFIGAWVPVDPTWLEAGHLDATHIQVSSTDSVFFETNAHALITPGSQLTFTSNIGQFGNTTGALNVTGMTESPALGDAVIGAGATTTHIGDETIVYLSVNGKDYRAVGLTLTPCISDSGSPVQLLDGADRILALRPNETRTVVWHVRSDPGLPAGFSWACPLTINSNYLDNATISLNFTPDSVATPSISAWLSRSAIPLGEPITVYYDVKAAPWASTIGIATSAGIRTAPPRTGTQKFEYTPADVGPGAIYIFSSAGGLKALSYTVSPDMALRIKSVALPANIVQGKPFSALVTLQNNASVPTSATTRVSLGPENRTATTLFAGLTSLNITLTPAAAGFGNVTVDLATDRVVDQYTQTIEVKPQPRVDVAGIRFAFVGSDTAVTFNITGSGDPRLINASIGSRTVPAQIGEISIESNPGNTVIALEWLDAAGNYYSAVTPLTVPAASQTPQATATPGGSGSLCPFAFLLPLAALCIAASGISRRGAHN